MGKGRVDPFLQNLITPIKIGFRAWPSSFVSEWAPNLTKLN